MLIDIVTVENNDLVRMEVTHQFDFVFLETGEVVMVFDETYQL